MVETLSDSEISSYPSDLTKDAAQYAGFSARWGSPLLRKGPLFFADPLLSQGEARGAFVSGQL